MASDARVRYTKMVIKEQFAAILTTTPLNKVTVKEICERAEINRATFYRYYADPYDLLEKMEQEFLEDMFKKLAESVSISSYFNYGENERKRLLISGVIFGQWR